MNIESYDALIFDCDGTLADTMPGHYVAWCDVLSRYGIPFDEARFYALGGVPSRDIVALLAREHGVSLDADAVADEKDHAYHDHLEAVQPVAPVVAIARQARGIRPMAVASGSKRWTVLQTLDHLGIRDWFGAVVAAEDSPRPKPAPDPFAEAARRLGADPARCLAFEDTDLGIESARAAGMDVVDVRELR